MGLTEQSFQLSADQVHAINQHIAKRRDAYLHSDEDIGLVSVKVEFEWVPGLGRFVTAHYDGELKGYEVEVADESTAS